MSGPATSRRTVRRCRRWRARVPAACALFAALFAVAHAASGQSLPALTTLPAPAAQPDVVATSRSVLFDPARAAEARARQQPQYVERIVVEARDPDARRAKPRAFEQRFADALLGPAPEGAVGLRRLDTTPCMSLQSTWNSLGSSFVPLSGCP